MADEKKNTGNNRPENDAAAQKAQKEAQMRAQREAAEAQKAKEKAAKEAQLKAQREAAEAQKAKERAEKEAQLQAKREAAAAQKTKEKAAKEATAAQKQAQSGTDGEKHKMTRREKKELLAAQKEFEKQAVAEQKIPLRNQYKPRGIFWRVFGVCLAFFLGIFSALGGLAGAGAILLSGPSKDVLSTLGIEDPEQFLSTAYLEKSLFEVYEDVMKDVNLLANPSELTLETFAKYSPLIDTYLNDLVDQNLQDLGISLDLNAIKQQKFSELGSYAKNELLPQVELGPILGLDTGVTLEKINDNAPMYALSYGKFGVDYTIGEGTDADGNATTVVEMKDGKKPKNITDLIPTLKADAQDGDNYDGGIMDVLGGIELGSFLGLDIRLESEKDAGDAIVYTLCYGTEGTDYRFESMQGAEYVQAIEGGKAATTVNTLLNESDSFLNDLSLGALLELNTAEKVADRDANSMMYSLCYGNEGEDYEISDDGLIVMKAGHAERTLGDLTTNSSAVIDSLQVESVLGIKPGSDAIMRTVAYGNELKKENGEYVKDENGKYKTETVVDDEGNETLQYVGGGRYILEGEGDALKVVMLPDPNDPDGKPYPKKTVGDLTAEDANLLDGVTLGSLLEITESSSAIMQAMQDWTIDDLKDQDMIESLEIGQILEIDDSSSGIMKAMQTWTLSDLQDQSKVESLKIGDVLNDSSSSKLMSAMSDWTLGDLNKQTRIERLKLSQIITINAQSSNIMKAMQDWRISELSDQSKIDALSLSDVITIDLASPDTPQMLKALHDMSIGEVSTSIDTLTLEDVLGEDAFTGNKILATLRHKQINEIGNAIQQLTIEQVFGDEIRSYAKKSAYDPQVRVNQTDKPDAGSVVTRYFVTGSQTEVFAGWYKGSDEAGWTKVDDALVKHNAYAEEKIYVERSVDHYLVVNYDNGDSSQWQRYSGQEEVLSDDFSCYYLDAEGVRHDLEPVYAYKHDGTAVEGKRILTEKSEGQPDKYYYMLKTDVTLRYAPEDGGTSYAQTQVETRYFGTVQGQQNTELVAYHAGVWYLLLEMDNETGADTPITEMGHLITKITGEINSITLGQMYLHELIDESPDISIEHFQYQKDDGGYYTNLNELTISGVIKLIRHISETFGH